MKIAVITGGEAAELEISLQSAEVVMTHLDSTKYQIFKVLLDEQDWIVYANEERIASIDKNDFSFTHNGEKHFFDLAFIVIHGTPAEDGKLQGYLDLMNVPYSVSGVWSSSVTFSKDSCKDYLKDSGVLLAKSIVLQSKDELETYTPELNDFQYPVFVKPNKQGSSYGISRIKSSDQLQDAVEKAFQYDDEVMIEEFIEGREITCGVYKQNGEIIALPITEIITSNDFFDYEAKYLGESEEVTPAQIPEKNYSDCQEMSRKLYRLLKCDGVIRADYILNNNQLYLLEVNTIPGLSEASLVPQQAVAAGLDLGDFFDTLINESLRA